MTKMIPPVCSPAATASEKLVFELIRGAEGTDGYFCFHSLGIARHDRKEYAEADLVVLGERGLFCIEVKGGVVQRLDGVWKIGGGDHSYNSTEGPFKQAEGARWALANWLNDIRRLPAFKETLVGWGVAFPNIVFEERDPAWDSDVVYDLRDRETSFRNYLQRLEHYFAARRRDTGKTVPAPMAHSKVMQYAEALRPDFEVGLTLRGLLIESRQEIENLSQEQVRVLDYTLGDHNHRLLCSGGPGTGKTVVALEASRRLTEARKSVLHLCYNKSLAEVLDRRERAKQSKFRIATLHSFFDETIKHAGLADRLRSLNALIDGNVFFQSGYPELFEEACAALLDEGDLPQFDVLVIDEAQDIFSPELVDCLGLVLEGGFDRGRWAIFYDPEAQANIYGRFDGDLLGSLRASGAVSTELTENFRNPELIALDAYRFGGVRGAKCRRHLPSPVEYLEAADDSTSARKLRAILIELIRDGIQPADVVLLSFKRQGERLYDKVPTNVGKPHLTPLEAEKDTDGFVVATVSGFKGLEAEIVILVDVPGTIDDAWTRSILMVALTRAKTKAFVIARPEFLELAKTLEIAA